MDLIKLEVFCQMAEYDEDFEEDEEIESEDDSNEDEAFDDEDDY